MEPGSLPLTIGSPECFERLRTALQELDYGEAAICRRTGIVAIHDFQTIREGRTQGCELQGPLDVLIRLLMDGETVEDRVMRPMLPMEVLEPLRSLGVIAAGAARPEAWHATAFLYPVGPLYIASDRTVPVDSEAPQPLPGDVVYAAITTNTQRFLATLPATPCARLLDLCSGTGIAALAAASRYARHAWACDITARSAHFAEFNRRLNGLENVTTACGDLYDAIGDATFDRIVAHPPYIPADKQGLYFRDGGHDGEQILKRIVEGLPKHLSPGGRFYALTFATDREGETIAQRVRRWLGEHEPAFDVLLVATELRKKPEKAVKAVPNTQLFEELRVTQVFYGAIVVARHGTARPPATAQICKVARAGSDAIEWFVRWETEAAKPGFQGVLLEARPRMAERLKLLVTHVVEDGALRPATFELKADYPFTSQGECQPWVAVLVGSCDGSKTVRRIYDEMREQQVIDPAMSVEEFRGVLRLLISNGFLEIPGFPLPKPSAAASIATATGAGRP